MRIRRTSFLIFLLYVFRVTNVLILTCVDKYIFFVGKPARLTDTNNIDWIPTVNMPEPKRSSIASLMNDSNICDQTDIDFTIPLVEHFHHELPVLNDHSAKNNDEIPPENKENKACHGPNVCQTVAIYEQELKRLTAQNQFLLAEVKLEKRDLNWITNDTMCKRYTGINNVTTLNRIFNFVETVLFQPVCELTKGQLFVMTLRKLRRNTPFTELADEYSVCANTISKYFHRTVLVLYENLKYALEVPPRAVSIRHTPRVFKLHYGDRRIFIIDCFEVQTETPINTKAATSHRSSYKMQQTTKFMIAMNSNGSVAFISKAYGGRCSDRFIIQDCGFLDILQENDVVLADKGFNISDLTIAKGATLNIPTFLQKKTQLNPLHIEKDKQITCLRVHVERLIGVLKMKYTYLNGPIAVDALRRFENGQNSVDIIVRVACILINFNKSIVPL